MNDMANKHVNINKDRCIGLLQELLLFLHAWHSSMTVMYRNTFEGGGYFNDQFIANFVLSFSVK